MNSAPASAHHMLKTDNLALAFQEVFTVILRTRFNVQPWRDADRMRAGVQQMIGTATQRVRAMGYSDEASQMALYAIVGFLDESVQNSKNPVFADWARRTLAQELFGDMLAGEKFFRHVAELLNRSESAEVADILELHCLCLLLGFRGRYAFGDASEIHTILSRIRQKIVRIRGSLVLSRQIEAPPVPKPPTRDRWLRNLSIAALVLAVVTLAAYLGFLFLLNQSVGNISETPAVRTQVPPAKAVGFDHGMPS